LLVFDFGSDTVEASDVSTYVSSTEINKEANDVSPTEIGLDATGASSTGIGTKRPASTTISSSQSCPDSSAGLSLLIHLGMTGQLVYRGRDSEFGGGHPTRSLIGKLPDFTTRAVFNFASGKLFFNDQRLFGYLELLPTSFVPSYPFIAKLGPEPYNATARKTQEFLARIRRHPKIAVKAAILDQAVVSGVGNIYADEALWLSKIHPATPVSYLDDSQLTELFENFDKVFHTSIAHGGSTSRNYLNAQGEPGRYLDFAAVYGRAGLPCLNCGTPIQKIKLAGRGTQFCPRCQVLPTF
jgi:formamidopyrimidine-DNA glycosylase